MLGRRSSSLLAAALVSAAAMSPVPAAASAAAHQWDAEQLSLEALGGALTVDGAPYRGRFELRAEGGRVRLVNEVGVEDYVRGIREMPPSWPIEAQRAQAIAARSYALHQALVARQEGRASDLCATAACQVYGGIAAERRGGPAWQRAVESTAAQVVAYRGTPILAMYSSSNGGRSIAASKPYLRSVPDPDDAASPHHRWRVEVPEAAVGAAVELPAGAELTGLARDGGVVVAHWEDPLTDVPETGRPIPVAEFRTRLEAAHPTPPGLPRLLPSTAFGVKPAAQPGSVLIEGRGWGHGIGMSQHGALGKARRGMDARRILAAYYGGLTPVEARAGQVPATIRVEIAAGGQLDLGGLGAFRVRADGTGVATGEDPEGWKAVVRKGRVVLTPPKGWQPAQPESPPAGSDPFDEADVPASAAGRAPVAVVPVTPPATDRAWRAFALVLLASVATGAFLLRGRPDPAPFLRG